MLKGDANALLSTALHVLEFVSVLFSLSTNTLDLEAPCWCEVLGEGTRLEEEPRMRRVRGRRWLCALDV